MDKYEDEKNKSRLSADTGDDTQKNAKEPAVADPNKDLKNVLLGKFDTKENQKDEQAEHDRMKDIYMKMTSEMANEITPEDNDSGLEKDSEHKVTDNDESNNKQTVQDNNKNNDNNSNNNLSSNKNNNAGKINENCKRPIDKTKVATQWLLWAVAVVVIGFLIYGWVNTNNKLQMNQNELVGVYYKSFDNITSEINDLEKKLAKVQIVSSEEMYVTLLTEIWNTSNIMRNEIGQLPLQTDVANELSRFVTQAGDFCYVLTKNILEGKDVTADQQNQLFDLQQNCADLANKLLTMRAEGKVVFLSAEEQAVVQTAAEEEKNPFETVKSSIQQYPSLIYDGPFSDSTKNQIAKWVDSMAEVSAEKAQETAVAIAGQAITGITRVDDVQGILPAYTFTVTYSDGNTSTINITKKGGKPLYLIQETIPGAAEEKPSDEAIAKGKEIAKTYLTSIGYKNMEPNYIQYYNGSILVNFAPVINDVTIYPDIIKVWVDITNFTVTGLDAKNYIYAHVDRTIKSPKLTTAQAKAYVSKNLTIDSVKLCIIPTETLTEDYCYEFSGVYRGLRFLTYIDADTGQEREVMEILDTDQGQMAE